VLERSEEPVQSHTRAVGHNREDLGAIATVDFNGVDAIAALIDVAPVAGIPHDPVVAAIAGRLVITSAAGEHVVVSATASRLTTMVSF
jgi:hypothetical protein